MRNKAILWSVMICTLLSFKAFGQIDESKTGAWYMYFWTTNIKQSLFGFQGDIQYRNWNLMGDLEQLLLRGGFTYTTPKSDVKFTLGYAHITTGAYGDDNTTVPESRIYQEALIPQKLGTRVYLVHRFRFEQRFVQDQNFRTRWRYNFFINVPLNKIDLKKGAVYIALYNELFINGERRIDSNTTVEIFDRNRAYGALGYSLSDNLRIQGGYMQQITDNWSKGQLQFSLHHSF